MPDDVKNSLSILQSNPIDDFPSIINTILTLDCILIDTAEYDTDNTITLISNIIKLLYSIPTIYFTRSDQVRILQMLFILERITISLHSSVHLTSTLSLSRKIIYNILSTQPSLKKVSYQSNITFLLTTHFRSFLSNLLYG